MTHTTQQFIAHWARSHADCILDLLIVGSQAAADEGCPAAPGSDVDLLVITRQGTDPGELMQGLAEAGLRSQVLFHPLIMTKAEWEEKNDMPLYRRMVLGGRRVPTR